MSELRVLRRHAGHYLGGRVGLLLLGFISFPLFTRLLTVAEYGEISLIFKVVIGMVVLAKLGIQNSVLRFFREEVEEGQPASARTFYSTFLFGAAGLSLLSVAPFLALLWLAPAAWISPAMRHLLLMAGLLVFIRALWSVLAGFFQAEGRTVVYNLFDLGIKAGTIAAICALLFFWRHALAAYLTATLLVEGLAVGFAIAMLLRRRLLGWSDCAWSRMRTAVLFGLPLAVYEIASVVLDSGDRFLVAHYLGAQQLGYYSAAYNLSSYAQISMMAPINLAIIPLYMKIWKERGQAETSAFLGRSLDVFVTGAIAVSLAGALVAKPMVVLLASAKYAPAGALLPILIVGLCLYALHIFLTPGLLIHKKTGLLARQVGYATFLNLGLNILLLPRLGIGGGAWATLISYAFLIVLIGRASFPYLAVPIAWRSIGVRTLAALLVYAGAAQIVLESKLLEVAVRASLGLVAYGVLLILADGNTRRLLAPWMRGRVRRGSSPLARIEIATETREA